MNTASVLAPLIALPVYAMPAGRVDGWADSAVAIQTIYVGAIQRAGGQEAMLAPRHLDRAEALAVLGHFDGVVLPGGGDVNPERYGQAAVEQTYGVSALRDEFEFQLCAAAIELKLPMLAICRGTQVLNVVRGGTLHQHIADDFPGHGKPGVEAGQNLHDVEIVGDSRVGRALGGTHAACSCHHHQSVDRLGDGLRVTAQSADGIVEAVELDSSVWVAGVQWHPEDTAADDAAQQGLFDALVTAARR
ncbi:MAG: gamma-glutamyl-gamma-aminobutyrate hydrolase family protein [Acidimicrobiia bacterium]